MWLENCKNCLFVCLFAWIKLIKLSPYIFQVLTTPFNLQVKWNGKRNGQIVMPVEYMENTCGLCGTFDEDPDNDFVTPDGRLVSLVVTVVMTIQV